VPEFIPVPRHRGAGIFDLKGHTDVSVVKSEIIIQKITKRILKKKKMKGHILSKINKSTALKQEET
jgi:hypothetical protein